MKFSFLLILGLLFLNPIFSQIEKGIQTLDESRAISDEIIKDITEEKISEAFDKIRDIWILPAAEINLLEKTTLEHFSMIEGRYGARIGFQYIGKKMVEGLGCEYTYVIKHENHALRFRLLFYQGIANLWYLNAFTWDDQMTEIIKEQPLIID